LSRQQSEGLDGRRAILHRGARSPQSESNETMSRKRATISDVAKASGISIGAVSRILNKDPTLAVREETRIAVHRTIAKLGYSPNPHARSLRMARTGSLAMILPEINSPAFTAMIQGAQKAAHERGYSMLLGGIGPDGDDPKLPARLLERNRVDGFLVSSGLRETQSLAALRSLGAPAVLLNRYLDDAQPHVVLDDKGGASALVRHLTDLGHRRIGFLGSPKRFLGTRRVAGYRAALSEVGISFDASLIADAGYTREGGESAMEALLSLRRPPTAVFTTNHLVAAGALVTAERRGITVPKDLSIGSFYDGPVAEILHPSLTAVRFPLEQLGFRATSMLIDLVEGKKVTQTSVILPHEKVVVRASTGPAANASVPPSAAQHRRKARGQLRPTRA
jgi:DNA-binding LacI/PurR family transcriptional regulator